MRLTYTKSAAQNMLRWDVTTDIVEDIIETGKVVQRTSVEEHSRRIHAGRLITVRHTRLNGEVLVINIQVTTSRRALREHQRRGGDRRIGSLL